MKLLEQLACSMPSGCCARGDAAGCDCITLTERSMYAAIVQLGFEYARYTCCVDGLEGNEQFSHSFSLNFSNFPAEWDSCYEQNRYYLYDPVVMMVMQNRDARLAFGTWGEAWSLAETEARRKRDSVSLERYFELREASLRHGVDGGVYMMLNSGQRRVLISLGTARSAHDVASQADETFYKVLFAMLAIVDNTLSLTTDCHACKRHLRIGGGNAIRLTPKQAKVLKLFKEQPSASNGDVARQLHVSTEAVVFHLKAIRRKFGMSNTSGHVLANFAMLHGLI